MLHMVRASLDGESAMRIVSVAAGAIAGDVVRELARLKLDRNNAFVAALIVLVVAVLGFCSEPSRRATLASWLESRAAAMRGALIALGATAAAALAFASFRVVPRSGPAFAVSALGAIGVALAIAGCVWSRRAPVRRVALVGVLVLVSASVRLGYLAANPAGDGDIDLAIYTAGGRLLGAGVNPYDWQDGRATREALRFEPGSFNTWVSETQPRWNHYASSNLPLTLLFFGVADRLGSTPFGYRMMFAAADVLLSVVIGVFVLAHWYRDRDHWRALIAALALGALSPILLNWGVRHPEDKGLQVLLMLGALHIARGARSAGARAASAMLLAGSVAFKGVGVLIAPLCALEIWRSDAAAPRSKRVANVLLYAGVAMLTGLVLFAPFLPEVITRGSERLRSHIGAPGAGHGSPFAPLAALWPGGWMALRWGFAAAFGALTLAGWLARRLPFSLVTANLLVLFVAVVLTTGSLDRLNLAFLPALLLMGALAPPWGLRFASGYAWGYVPALVLAPYSESYDQIFALLLLLGYTGFVAAVVFGAVKARPGETRETRGVR
jgi:hypothetical protein